MIPRIKKLIMIACLSAVGAVVLIEVVRVSASGGGTDTTFNTGGEGASGDAASEVFAAAARPDCETAVGGDSAAYKGDAAAPGSVLRLLPGPGSLAFSSTSYNVTEAVGNATVTVNRAGGTDNQVVGKVTLTDVTTSPADYRFTPGARDTTFNAGGSGANALFYEAALQPDGKVIIGGLFNAYNGDSAAPDSVMRLNADGARDTTFNAGGAGADSFVYAAAVQPDGKIIVGGWFTSYNGVSAAPDYVMRLNADGTRDTTFNVGGAGADSVVFAVALQPDGKIIIGGQFTSYNGDSAAPDYVIRLNADGTRDTTFNPGGAGANLIVIAAAVQPDGKIIIGGSFTDYNGDPAAPDRLMRLNADGTRDATFNAAGSTDGSVYAVALQPDGKVIIGGSFLEYDGDPAAPDRLVRLNADGTRDTTFNPSGAGANLNVYAAAVQPDGKILIGGEFTSYNGDAATPDFAVRLNADGTRDATFNAGGAGANNSVEAVVVQPDGKVIIGGQFNDYNGDPAAPDRVMRLDGDLFVTWQAGDAADKVIRLPIINDVTPEADETLTLTLSVISGGASLGSPGSATLTIGKADQTINVNTHAPANAAYNSSFTVAATSDSGLPVSYSSSGVCTNVGAVFNMTGGTGTCTVKYDQAGDEDHDAAAQVTETVAAQKAGQTITFDALAGKTFGDADFTVSATASSNLPVSFAASGQCTISGSTVHLTGPGSCTIKASQAGDGNYNGAADVPRTFSIADAQPTLGDYPNTSVNLGAGATLTPAAAPTNTSGINVSTSTGFNGTFAANPSTGVVRVTNASPAGTYTVTVKAFNGAASTTRTFTLTVQSGTACNGASVFTGKPDAGVGSGPFSVAIGDFNSDGKQDLAVANSSSNTVSIRLGDGGGGFSGSTEVNVGSNPFSVAVGDFNADGKQDIAATNGINNVSIRLGDGGGGFSGTTQVSVGSFPEFVTVGDFNGDGRQDIATSNTSANTVSIRLGDGLGGFGGSTEVSVGTRPQSVVVGDFNGDGKQDIATASYDSNAVSIRLGDGLGGFGGTTEISVGANPESIALGDFNGDGKQDIAVTNASSSSVSIRLGNGLGGFGGTTDVGVSQTPRVVAIGDFNNDGKQDIATASDAVSKTVSIRLGDGGGGFSGTTEVSAGGGPITVVVGDFNSDGRQDIATAGYSENAVSIRLGECDSPPTITAVPVTRPEGRRGANVIIANVSDAEDGTNLAVKVNGTAGAFVNGIFIGGLSVNAASGAVSADVEALCGASTTQFALKVTDSRGVGSTATLTVTVSPSTAPTLSYGSPQNVSYNEFLTVTPTTGPADDSLVDTNVSVQSKGTYAGTISVNGHTGVVSLGNAAPAGTHTITLRVTNHCGKTTDAAFNLVVAKASTATALTSSANPSAPGQSVTFNAKVSSGAGTPAGTVTFKDGGSAIPACGNVALSSGQATCSTAGLTVGSHAVTAEYSGDSNFAASTGALSGGQLVGAAFGFTQSLYTVAERGGSVTVTVRRAGDTSQAAGVDYFTDDGSDPSVTVPCSATTGSALERCDYTRAAGTLRFEAGEAEKTFRVLVGDDSLVEGTETTQLRLSNPTAGGVLGAVPTATLEMTDDAQESTGNPNDDSENFVRQHYHDFLNREPDAGGLNFWKNGIESCGTDAHCRQVKRIDTSAAFFLSIEFQETGFLVHRLYKAAFGEANGIATIGGVPTQIEVPVVRLGEFLPDTQRIARDVIVGTAGWPERLDANKAAFAREFVSREGFKTAFPSAMTPEQFVNTLNTNAGGVLSETEMAGLVAELTANNTEAGRASVLRKVAEDSDLAAMERNKAFVLMQYFGYMRRNPNDSPDTNHSGYNFWLGKLDEFGGDFGRAQMVQAFIESIEYRRRFAR